MANVDPQLPPRASVPPASLERFPVSRDPRNQLLGETLPLIDELKGLLPAADGMGAGGLNPTVLNALREVADKLVSIGGRAAAIQAGAAERQTRAPSSWVWQDGEFHPWSEATVPLDAHSLHYGTAVFEGIRCYQTDKGPAVFRLDEHIDRLFYSAKTMGIWDAVGYQREVKHELREHGHEGVLREVLLAIEDRAIQLDVLGYGIGNLAQHATRPQTLSDVLDLIDYQRPALRKLVSMPYSREEVREAICATIRANQHPECYIRPVVYFGSKLGLDVQGAKPHLAILTLVWDKGHGSEYSVWESAVRRNSARAIDPHAKVAGNYVNSVRAKLALPPGYQGTLLCDVGGRIAEGPGENLFLVIDGALHTPPSSEILPGITRHTIMCLADTLGVPVHVRKLETADLRRATEAFFVGTAAEVTPISGFGRAATGEGWHRVPPYEGSDYVGLDREGSAVFHQPSGAPEYHGLGLEGPITRSIKKAYGDAVRGKITGLEGWLTPIDTRGA